MRPMPNASTAGNRVTGQNGLSTRLSRRSGRRRPKLGQYLCNIIKRSMVKRDESAVPFFSEHIPKRNEWILSTPNGEIYSQFRLPPSGFTIPTFGMNHIHECLHLSRHYPVRALSGFDTERFQVTTYARPRNHQNGNGRLSSVGLKRATRGGACSK